MTYLLLKIFRLLNWLANPIPLHVKEQFVFMRTNKDHKPLNKINWEEYKAVTNSKILSDLYTKRVEFLKENYTEKQLTKYGINIAENGIGIDVNKCPMGVFDAINAVKL